MSEPKEFPVEVKLLCAKDLENLILLHDNQFGNFYTKRYLDETDQEARVVSTILYGIMLDVLDKGLSTLSEENGAKLLSFFDILKIQKKKTPNLVTAVKLGLEELAEKKESILQIVFQIFMNSELLNAN